MIEIKNFTPTDAEFVYCNCVYYQSWDGCKFEKELKSIKKLSDKVFLAIAYAKSYHK